MSIDVYQIKMFLTEFVDPKVNQFYVLQSSKHTLMLCLHLINSSDPYHQGKQILRRAHYHLNKQVQELKHEH